MAMPIVIACQCGKKLQAKDELAGKRVKCPQCGQPLTVPAPGDMPTRSRKAMQKAASES